MFFTVGPFINLEKAIYLPEKRGFTWQSFLKTPFRRTKFFDMPGTTIILLERAESQYLVRHFFHILEHLIGIWSFGGERDRQSVQLVVIAGNGNMEFTKNWSGPNNISIHLIKALFPCRDKIMGRFCR